MSGRREFGFPCIGAADSARSRVVIAAPSASGRTSPCEVRPSFSREVLPMSGRREFGFPPIGAADTARSRVVIAAPSASGRTSPCEVRPSFSREVLR